MPYVVEVPPPTTNPTTNADMLQAAFDAARPGRQTVVLGLGTYTFNRPLVLGGKPEDTGQSFVSLVGQGPLATTLAYSGPTDQGAALTVSRDKYCRLEGFSITGPGRGQGYGLEIGAAGPTNYNGTVSNGIVVKQVNASSWLAGFRFGRWGSASCSELTLEQCEVSFCTNGIQAETFNTLNISAWMLGLNNCDTGMDVNGAGSISVYGGHGHSNGLTFNLRTGGRYSIRDFRDEGAFLVKVAGTTAWTVGLIEGCQVIGTPGPGIPSLLSGWGGELVVIGCQLNGPIYVGAQHAQAGGITMLRTAVNDSEPFRPTGGAGGWSYPYQVLGCARADVGGNNQARFPDEIGLVVAGVRTPTVFGGGSGPHTHPEYAPAGHSHPVAPLPTDLTLNSLTIGQTVLREANGQFVIERAGSMAVAFGLPAAASSSAPLPTSSTTPPTSTTGEWLMALTKVTEQTLLAPTQTGANAITLGGAVDTSLYYAADVRIRMGRNSTSPFTAGPTARLEGTYASTSGNAMQWTVLAQFQAAIGSNVAGQALTTAAASNATALQLAAGTNFAAGDYAFIANATIAQVEWARIYAMSGATAQVEQALVNTHASGTVVYDQSEQYHALIDLTAIQKIRLVIDGAGSAVAVTHAAEFGALSGL